jgi:NAD(P)-dependent dehydrogenase (short-subunit alcohol dehydrogenase family)
LEIASALLADGWTVIAHVRRREDSVPQGSIKVAAELADGEAAERIFAAARGAPPVRLLVNSAARFAFDGFGRFDPAELDSHMAVNLRAPLLLMEAFAVAHESGGDGLIVNLLDAKLAAPNPDFLSYTLSKQALAGATKLAARAFAPKHIRVNGIAPALMLRSPGQSEDNFRAMHRANPLARGVVPHDVVTALRYLIDAPAVTGEILTIDSGQSFWSPERDVQFLERP